jgi:hypothetical protein
MMRGQSVINLSLASKLGPNCGRQVSVSVPQSHRCKVKSYESGNPETQQ